MSISENIAATVRAEMKKQNKSLLEFSQELGIARSSLQNYLREGSSLRADTIELLADHLGLSPAELISGPDASQTRPKFPEIDPKQFHHLLQPVAAACQALSQALQTLSARLENGEAEKRQTDTEA